VNDQRLPFLLQVHTLVDAHGLHPVFVDTLAEVFARYASAPLIATERPQRMWVSLISGKEKALGIHELSIAPGKHKPTQ
jgi:hypothetical protein